MSGISFTYELEQIRRSCTLEERCEWDEMMLESYMRKFGHHPLDAIFNKCSDEEKYRWGKEILKSYLNLFGPDAAGAGTIYAILGTINFRFQEFDKSIQDFAKSLSIFQSHQDTRSEMLALNEIGVANWYQDEYYEAEAVFREAVELIAKTLDPSDEDLKVHAHVLENMAVVFRRLEKRDKYYSILDQLQDIPSGIRATMEDVSERSKDRRGVWSVYGH